MERSLSREPAPSTASSTLAAPMAVQANTVGSMAFGGDWRASGPCVKQQTLPTLAAVRAGEAPRGGGLGGRRERLKGQRRSVRRPINLCRQLKKVFVSARPPRRGDTVVIDHELGFNQTL